MTQYIKGNKGHNKKDHILIRQFDDKSEIIKTAPITELQAIRGLLQFENSGFKILKIERIK